MKIGRLLRPLLFVCLPLSTCGGLFAFDPQQVQNPFSTDQAIVLPFTSSNEEVVSVKMINEEKAIRPGKAFWTCFQFTIGPEWHLYWKNPGDAGAAPSILWTLPEGFTAGEPLWPFPERFDIEDAIVYGYEKQVLVLVPIYPPNDLVEGERITLKAEVQWLGCSRTCVPGNAFFSLQVPVTTRSSQTNLSAASLFRQARKWLPVEAKTSVAVFEKGLFQVTVFPRVPLEEIHYVQLFFEERDVVDTHSIPRWQAYDAGGKFVVELKDEALQKKPPELPLKAVLVVKDGKPNALKIHAWLVTFVSGKLQAQAMPTPKQKSVERAHQNAHIEKLEKDIWYRTILDSLNSLTGSELVKIILFAFVGGMLLNVMPCVLPVISMKMLQFVELQKASKLHVARHGLVYSLGILVAFWILAGAIFLLQSLGKVVGWGFQLQEPLFVALLSLVLFVLGLGLFGVFEFGVGLSSRAASLQDSLRTSGISYTGSFLSGVLATFVATPCTGPLLGSAIGFAAIQKPIFSFMIFTSLGLGLAFPFILVSFIPGVHRLVPRPGAWMVTFKQLMGFFMLATVLWLVWVLDAEVPELSSIAILASLLFVGFGVWVYGTWARFDRHRTTRILASIIALLIGGFGAYVLLADVYTDRKIAAPAASQWQPFSKERLERLLKKNIPVFVAVSAKWCLTCHANHAILDIDAVEKSFAQYGVVKLLADWTNGDEEITKYLRAHGRNGVPMYVVYSRDPKIPPVVLPEVLTPDIVISAVRDAAIPVTVDKG